jgi:hypothetical protein
MFMKVSFQWLFAAFILLTAFGICGFYLVTTPKKRWSPIGVVSAGCLCGPYTASQVRSLRFTECSTHPSPESPALREARYRPG